MARAADTLFVLAALVASRPALAQEPAAPADPVLATLIEQSLGARPELAQARATVKALRERVPQAGAFPDPMLQVGLQNDGFKDIEIGKMATSYVSIMASQTFPWLGKQGLRSEVAELEALRAATGILRLRLSTEADVRRAYLELALVRDRLALLDRLEALWRESAAVARVRYEAGEGAQSDLMRTQLELNRLQQRRWALQGQERAQLQALNRLRDHALEEAIETKARVSEQALPKLPDEQAAAEDALARSPELVAAKLALKQAEKSVDLANKGLWPDISVSVGIMVRGGDFPPMWQVGLGGNLPIFAGDKQNRAVAENEARVLASRKGIEAVEQVLRLRAQQRRTALQTTLQTIHLYLDGLLVQSQATARSTLAQYQVGKASFASVLEANAGYLGDEEGLLQSLAEAQRIQIASAEASLDVAGTAMTAAERSSVAATGM